MNKNILLSMMVITVLIAGAISPAFAIHEHNATSVEATSVIQFNATSVFTNFETTGLLLTHSTTGVVGDGLGVTIDFAVEDSADADRFLGSINATLSDTTATTIDGRLGWNLVENNALGEKMSLSSTGLLTVSGGIAGNLGQFAGTTSAELLAELSDPTGTGLAVFASSPTLVTPALGTPSALVLTSATGLPVAAGLLTASSADFAGRITDESGTGVVAYTISPTFTTPALGTPSALVLTSATGLPVAAGLLTASSADFAGRITDETGTGVAVFATAPHLIDPITNATTGDVNDVLTGMTLSADSTQTNSAVAGLGVSLNFAVENDADNDIVIATINGTLADPANNGEDGQIGFNVKSAGILVERMALTDIGSLVFEGATDDAVETTLVFTDPTTADKTITMPDATGTVLVSSSIVQTASEAIDLLTLTTILDTSGTTPTLTLASGLTTGQIKIITMSVFTNTATVTGTITGVGTSITFDAIGESLVVIWTGAAWQILTINGATINA